MKARPTADEAAADRPAPESEPHGPLRGPWLAAAVIALLAAHSILAYTATLGASTTFDEPLHMVAGVAYWTLDDYRLQPENGNLPQRWCAIPLLFMNLTFPTLDQKLWQESEAVLLGRQYLYTCGNDPQAMLAASRAMATVWSTALCLVVFLWSRSIFGPSGGLVSLALAAFWPALVAHGPLATSDACGALFFTLGAWSLWKLFHAITPGTLGAAFFAIGIAPIAKHSSVMLAPLAVVYLATITALGRPLVVNLGPWKTVVRGRGPRTALALASLLVPLAGAVFFIWASCGFRYDVAGPGCGPQKFRRYETLASCNEHAGTIGRICDLLAAWRLLPEGWLYGMSYVGATVRIRNAFAIGRYSIDGWWWYFPLCFAIKNTLPSLVLSLWGVGLASRRVVHSIVGRVPLAPTAYASLAPLGMLVVLWPTFLTSHLNIGERHMLPSYPALMVLAGGTVTAFASPWLRRVLVLLLVLHAFDVASRWPSSLAYFNQIVPRGREYRWLVDSNLDWGQDARRLQAWLDRHLEPSVPYYVCYFGSAHEPLIADTDRALGIAPGPGRPQVLRPGVYCVSATLLQSVYDEPLGPWCEKFESTYQRAREFVETQSRGVGLAATAEAIVTASGESGVNVAPSDGVDARTVAESAVYAFNILQSGRLRAYLRHREPDATVGGSILIFRLSAGDLDAALRGPPAELLPESWMQRDSRGDVVALVRRGDALFDAGKLVEAEATLEQARRLDPYNAKAWARLGLVYAARERHDKAIAAYEKAARLAPSDAEPLYNLGLLLATLGRTDEALAAFGLAIDRNPRFADALFNRGILRLRRGATREAHADFQRYVELGGTLPAELRPLVAPLEEPVP
jgi:tetratricopeptide (TPR) repeat protein